MPASAAAIATLACCHCGAAMPSRGPNARWKRGFRAGSVMCLACSAARPRSLTCPVCGVVYKRECPWTAATRAHRRAALQAAAAARECDGDYTNGYSSDEDTGADDWLVCDDCHRWVMARCDDSVTSVAQYSDDNPRHLHYSCPLCRRRRTSSPGTAAPASATAATAPTATVKGSDAVIKSVLESLSRRCDELVAGTPAQRSRDELAAFKANLLKRCEGSLRRVVREQEALVERADKELQTQRAEIEQDFSHQFRDQLDRHHAAASHRQ